jgi:formate dehydrogenase
VLPPTATRAPDGRGPGHDPRVVPTFCRICESLCGLQATVEGGEIIDLKPDEAHVATRGFACIKGLKQHEIYAGPDRVRRPRRRVGDRFEEASWEEALADIGARVRAIRGAHGADAIAMYVGTAAGFSALHPVFAQGFMTGLGSKSMYSSATQDCSNKFAVAHAIYGFPFTQPFPDVEHTECLVIVGANPVVSKWSFLQVPNPKAQLEAIERRGGRIWVIDPRRTETAKAAGRHVFIRPGTDVFFYLAFLHEVLARGEPHDVVAAHGRGLELLRPLVAPWTPERCAEVTKIPAATLREIVADFVSVKGAAMYSSTGVNMGAHGGVAFWLQEVINFVTGNLDRRGGTLVGRGVIDFPAFAKPRGILVRPDRSRIGDRPSVNDAFPGALLADEILTAGEGKVRALFVTGGNPLITMANAGRLRRAFSELDLLVTVDILHNETGALADWVLPATTPFERADLPFIFPLMLGLQARPYLQATRAILEPAGEQRDEATIYLQLARACGAPIFGSGVAQRLLEGMMVMHGLARGRGRQPAVPVERLLSTLLWASGHGTFRRLLRHPHGRLREAHQPGSFLGKRVLTEDGKVDLAPSALVEELAHAEVWFGREQEVATTLKLVTKRAVTTHNSWTHNHAPFVEGDRGTNYLYVHPEDAARLGLRDGALADVTSATATVRVPVRLLAELMPGAVALPHGWGHQHAKGLSVASRTRGVNVNLLAADGPEGLEPVTNMAHLTAIPVEVRPAAGPQDPESWSGLPDDRLETPDVPLTRLRAGA